MLFIATDRGADPLVLAPQVARPFLKVLRQPLPRIGVRDGLEGPQQPLTTVDCGEGEVAAELLLTAAAQHRLEDLLILGSQTSP
jgi:hypothetical protein